MTTTPQVWDSLFNLTFASPPPTPDHGYHNDVYDYDNDYYSDEDQGAAVVIAFIGLLLVVGVILSVLKHSQITDNEPNRNAATAATRNRSPRSPPEQTPPQWDSDLEQGMTPAQREEYVSNVLNTQKFEATMDETSIEDDDETASSVSTNEEEEEELAVDVSVRGCAICLDTFNPSDTVCISNNEECQHIFHRHCAHEWFLKNEDCPCCRRPYLSSTGIVEV